MASFELPFSTCTGGTGTKMRLKKMLFSGGSGTVATTDAHVAVAEMS